MLGVKKKLGNCNYKLVVFFMQITFLELVACHLCTVSNSANTSHTHRSTIIACLKNSII